MVELKIRRLKKEDITKIIKIEKQVFSNPWAKEVFLKELQNNYGYYIVGLLAGEIVSYLGCWLLLGHCHITNLATCPQKRRHGFASQMLKHLYNELRAKKITRITLEVRASNLKAQKLYQNEGFIKFAIKEDYYSDNNEDAVTMWKEFEIE